MLGPCSIRHYLSTGSFPSACEHAYGDSNLKKQNQRPALIPVLLQATTKSFLLQNILTIFYLNLLQALSSFLLYSSPPSLPPPPSPPHTHSLTHWHLMSSTTTPLEPLSPRITAESIISTLALSNLTSSLLPTPLMPVSVTFIQHSTESPTRGIRQDK